MEGKFICIDCLNNSDGILKSDSKLTLGKLYIHMSKSPIYSDSLFILIYDDDNRLIWVDKNKFISIEDAREKKFNILGI